MPLTAPVAFLIFNRPDTTRRVFARIAQAQPTQLLVVCDGPRKDRPGEAELVAQSRAIIDEVDWPCQVLTDYSDVNLGCKRRIASGLDWIFQTVDEAIIVEDDCLPDPTFFDFCQQMLDRYRDDDRIATIGGVNFQNGQSRTDHSYYFSKYFHCWGWASWRRVWEHYDCEMATWPEFLADGCLRQVADSIQEHRFWENTFSRQYRGEIDSWDFQWQYCCWKQGGLTALPDRNLVTNIGFGSNATHTTVVDHPMANIPSSPLSRVDHPKFVVRNRDADIYTFENVHRGRRPRGIRKWHGKINRYLEGLAKAG